MNTPDSCLAAPYAATHAKMAYLEPDELAKRFVRSNVKELHWLHGPNTQGFLKIEKQRIVLSFRGTEPTKIGDWLADLKLWKRQTDYGHVHAGFNDGTDEVWRDIRRLIRGHESKLIHVVGHSLGGAIGTVATVRLASLGLDVFLDTFGCPRVGAVNFQTKFKSLGLHYKHRRWVYACDAVPRVPFEGFSPFMWSMFNYRHVGVLHYIDRHNRVHIEPSYSLLFKERFMARMEARCLFGRLTRGVRDHDMDNYVYSVHRNYR